jgi:hypothetical protein
MLYYPYLIDMEAFITMKDWECAFADDIEELSDLFTGIAEEFDDLAESLDESDEEFTEQIAIPLANALDSITAIMDDAIDKVMEVGI